MVSPGTETPQLVGVIVGRCAQLCLTKLMYNKSNKKKNV